MLQLPSGDFEGYIFDCDGTLADSMPVHYHAWAEAFKAHGATFDFTWDLFYSMAGMGLADSVHALNDKFGTTLDPHEVVKTQMDKLDEFHHEVTPIDDVVAVARQVIADGRHVSVSSGGVYRHVHETLHVIGAHEMFPVIITREDYRESKPAPDCFLLAAERMGVPYEQCIVFEDSLLGIEAAKRAGMASVFIDPAVYSKGATQYG